jgi:hypothetical protein
VDNEVTALKSRQNIFVQLTSGVRRTLSGGGVDGGGGGGGGVKINLLHSKQLRFAKVITLLCLSLTVTFTKKISTRREICERRKLCESQPCL